jgi:hypothetical protein
MLLERKNFILIRIIRHANKSHETQVAGAEKIASVVLAVTMVCYMGVPHLMRINLINVGPLVATEPI